LAHDSECAVKMEACVMIAWLVFFAQNYVRKAYLYAFL